MFTKLTVEAEPLCQLPSRLTTGRSRAVRARALPMAFFARGTDWLKKNTKQSQL